jgi:hypothetical protein
VKITKDIIDPPSSIKDKRLRSIPKARSFWLVLLAFQVTVVLSFGGGYILSQKKYNIALYLKSLGWAPLVSDNIDGTVRWVLNILNPIKSNAFPTIHLDIKHKNYLKLIEKLEDVVRGEARPKDRGLLNPKSVVVPGFIRYQGQAYKVKLRHKGVSFDHRNTGKMSLRISIKDGKSLFGMQEFAIQHPVVRGFLMESGYMDHLRIEGVLAPRYQYINVVFNGTKKGIFALEEHFSKELVESQGRREGVLLRLKQNFLDYSHTWRMNMTIFTHFSTAEIGSFKSKRILKREALKLQYQIAHQLLEDFRSGKKKTSEVFDIPNTAKYLAVTELWNACHAEIFGNIRFYYNPITSLLEPVGYDAESTLSSLRGYPASDEPSLCTFNRGEFALELLSDKEMVLSFEKELRRILHPEYIENLQKEMSGPYEGLRQEMRAEYPYIPKAQALFNALKFRAQFIMNTNERRRIERGRVVVTSDKEKYHPLSRIQGYFTLNQMNLSKRPVVEIHIANTLPEPIELVGIKVEQNNIEKFIPAEKLAHLAGDQSDPLWLPAKKTRRPLQYVSFMPPRDVSLDAPPPSEKLSIKVVVKAITDGEAFTYPVFYRYFSSLNRLASRPKYPAMGKLLSQHPFLKLEKNLVIRIQPGTWNVLGNLLIPPGYTLKIDNSVVLRFEKDAIFVTSSSTQFQGSLDNPVVFEPIGDSWGGFAALQAGESQWKHVQVKGASNVRRGGWALTGGLTFFKSDIHMNNVNITNSLGEDALNIVNSKFQIEHSTISDTVSDALDADFSQGKIDQCVFKNIGGDAIDFSGSKIKVTHSYFKNIQDKAISAGEASQVTGMGLEVVKSGIGIASKDASLVEISDSTLREIRGAALSAFLKKNEYNEGGVINAKGMTIINVGKTSQAQEGSKILLDGRLMPAEKFSTDQMYTAEKSKK